MDNGGGSNAGVPIDPDVDTGNVVDGGAADPVDEDGDCIDDNTEAAIPDCTVAAAAAPANRRRLLDT